MVESGLFIGRADPVFVADGQGVHRLDSARAHRGSPPVLVVMGVSGAGKSTVAEELAARLGWPFEEGDALHPEANVAKMHAGIPLTDADRQPWLERVAAWIDGQRAKKQPGIITCSALKRSYRRIVIGDRPEVRLVYLRGGRDLIGRASGGAQRPFHAGEPAAKPDRYAGGTRTGRGAFDRRRRAARRARSPRRSSACSAHPRRSRQRGYDRE